MKLRNICILTENVTKLYMFYSKILQINTKIKNTDYVEFKVGNCNIALFNVKCHNEMELEPVKEILNTNILIEIQVDNLDIEYERLKKLKIKWCKLLTTQPWGTRSIYFFDPDGNVINFFEKPKKYKKVIFNERF